MAYNLFLPPSSFIGPSPPTPRSFDSESLCDDHKIEVAAIPHNSSTERGLTWKLLEGWPLCHFCQAIVSDLPASGRFREVETRVGGLKTGLASANCVLCHAILQLTERLGWDGNWPPIRVRVHGPENLEIGPIWDSGRFLSLAQGNLSTYSSPPWPAIAVVIKRALLIDPFFSL